MLITEMKDREVLDTQLKGKVFLISCHGCKEISFPEQEAEELKQDLIAKGVLTGFITTDYICNPENMVLRLQKHMDEIDEADTVLVLSCGVGVQSIAEYLEGKRVLAGCDTYRLPGFQGVTPLPVDCGQCGECYLNLTGGICPITACSKSLVNGQCGGAKDGKCEVDHGMDCGWEMIYRRLKKVDRLDLLMCPVQVRDYSNEEKFVV